MQGGIVYLRTFEHVHAFGVTGSDFGCNLRSTAAPVTKALPRGRSIVSPGQGRTARDGDGILCAGPT